MRLSQALLIAALGLPAAGCGHRSAPSSTVPAAPAVIRDIDGFALGLNQLALLPDGHPERASRRAALSRFLVEYLGEALERGDEAEAESALEHALTLYTPTELRTAESNPALAGAAHRLYRSTARRGAELPSMLALAVEQRFGDESTRARALRDWQALEKWLVDNGPFATEPLLRHEELERALEVVAASFPTPFVVQRLSDLYVARYESAVRAHAHGGGLGNTSLRRVEITGYLLMRLYLRADDPEGAVAALARVKEDAPVAKLKEIVEDAYKSRRSARPLLSLADQFVPEEDADPSLPYVTQSWGIIDSITRRALDRYPKDPFVHLLRARTLRRAGLTTAAIHHLRRSIDLKDDVYEAWQQLAQLEQYELVELAQTDAKQALERLASVEALHQRAMKLWRDRPVRPALPEAYFTVAEGLYREGMVDDAQTLLDKSLQIEAQPHALDLLGTIALKRSSWKTAQGHYEDLAKLPHDESEVELRWEARARGQLGEIALRQGDSKGSTDHFRVALEQTNKLLSQPATTARTQADRHLDRGRLLFFLGETGLAIDDFEFAAEIAPDYVKVYAEPMLQLISHGYYQEARSVFHRAMDRHGIGGSFKLYFSLWLNDLALRQGELPDTQAQKYLLDYTDDRWGAKLARHARGELTYEKLLDGARDDGERAEAFFYEGIRAWRSGDHSRGKALLRQVVETNLMGFFEYDMAQVYLGWGELPARARAPMPDGVARRRPR